MEAPDQPVIPGAGEVEGLPPVFEPSRAAEVLHRLGLSAITECALKTRAYRKQVPCHRNGHRIIFTLDDLKEIAQGQAQRPVARGERKPPSTRPETPAQRRLPRQARKRGHDAPAEGAWRARRRFDA
jgi:hypothetical protein